MENGKTTTRRKPPATVRGVSYSDYRAFARLVRMKKTTWNRLEREGKVSPPGMRTTDAYKSVMGGKRKGGAK